MWNAPDSLLKELSLTTRSLLDLLWLSLDNPSESLLTKLVLTMWMVFSGLVLMVSLLGPWVLIPKLLSPLVRNLGGWSWQMFIKLCFSVTDNLFSQAVISQNLVAISFEPTTELSVTNGELTFGGTDSSKFVGSINFAWVYRQEKHWWLCWVYLNRPITKKSPASKFWGIDQAIRFGTTSILSKTAGIVDTGTTLTLIATG